MRRGKAVWVLRSALVMGGIVSLIFSYHYCSSGIPYVAVTSSNPNPSDVARVMGPRMMDLGMKWLYVAILCVLVFAATFLIKRRQKTPERS